MAGGVSFATGLTEMMPDVQSAPPLPVPLPVSMGGTGVTALGNNQVIMGDEYGGTAGCNLTHRLIAYATALDFSKRADIPLKMNWPDNLGTYLIRTISWGLPASAAFITSGVSATIRSAPSGTGQNLSGSLTAAALFATTTVIDVNLISPNTVLTTKQLYASITTATASAGTAQVFIIGDCLDI